MYRSLFYLYFLVVCGWWSAAADGQSLATRRGLAATNSLDQVLAQDATLHDVHFADAQHGWAVGDRGVVIATDDGGVHWYSQRSGVDCPLLSVSFVDAGRGWIVGGRATPMTHRSEAVVLRTIDGGATWQPMAAPTLPRLAQVKFFDAAHGVALGYGSSFYPSGVFTTRDGGKSWQPLASAEQSTWLAGSFLNADNGLLVGASGARAVVIDRELRPTPLAATDPRQPRGVALANATTAWIAGDEGLVLRSTDSGVTWQPPSAPPMSLSPVARQSWRWNAVAAVGDHVWLAGSPGSVIVHSTDGGGSWTAASTGAATPIRKLTFTDALHGWAVGDLGVVLATDDGGRTWQRMRGAERAAMVAVTSTPDDAPLELLARYGVGEGYRATLVSLFDSQPGKAQSVDPHRTAEALAGVATSDAQWLWPGATPPSGFHASPESLLAELNRQTDGLAHEQLVARLATAIRIWRPDLVVVPHCRDNRSHAADALIEQLTLEAIRVAGDPAQLAELAGLGVAPHQVKRVVGRLSHGERGAIRLATDDFVPQLGGSPAGWCASVRGLLHTRFTVPPPLEEMELIQQQDGLAVNTRDLFAGIALMPGGDARRAAVATNPADLDRLRRLTQKRGQLVRLLDYAEGSPVWSAQVVSLTGGLDAQAGGELMYQLAEGYRETGRHAMAADTLYLLARRYPDHPLTEQALTWLVRYYASGEVAYVASRQQAQDARTRPLANVANIEQAATAALPAESTTGTSALSADERFERATMLGRYLEQARPAVHAEPALRFPLAVASRKLGFVNPADRYFAVLAKANVNTAWGEAARAENWLSQPDELPPNKPLVACRQSPAPPHLDGALDESFWQQAETARIATTEGRDDNTAATLQLARDETYLYIGITCPRLRDESYAESEQPRIRDAALSGFDRVQLSLDVDRDYGSAYELTVDCRGWTHDACWGDANWDPRWFVARGLTDDAWTAEVAIAWSELSDPEPAVLDAWCLRAVRNTSRGHAASWTGTADDSPASFGLLLFR